MSGGSDSVALAFLLTKGGKKKNASKRFVVLHVDHGLRKESKEEYRFVRSLAKRLAGTPYAAISAGIAGGLVASYVQSCLEWVLRQQMNLILLMMFFALLDHIKANARRLAEQNRETEGVK